MTRAMLMSNTVSAARGNISRIGWGWIEETFFFQGPRCLPFRIYSEEAKAQITEVSPAEVEPRLGDDDVLVLDVREHEEYEQGAIPGAHLIPRGLLESSIFMQAPDPDTEIVVYCAGRRPFRLGRPVPGGVGVSQCGLHGRRVRPLEGGRPPLVGTGDAFRRSEGALQPTHHVA